MPPKPRPGGRRPEVREVERARQRLRDPRGREPALGAEPRSGSGASATRTSASAPTASCCSRAARTPTSSPSCGSSTPTAPRPSSRATAPARRSSTCAARAGPTPTSSRSRPRRGRSRRRSPPSAPARSRWARRLDDLAGLSRGRRRTAAARSRPAGATWGFQHVSIGNPQCAIEVGRDELEQLDLPALGPAIERNELFPNRTNVCFYRVDDGQRVRARIFERGVGETLSSGTGASGAAVARLPRGRAEPVTVRARRRRARGRGRARSSTCG